MTRLDPHDLVVRIGSTIRLVNDTMSPHVVSCPQAHLIEKLAPGEALDFELTARGKTTLFLLDVPGVESTIFGAPGSYARASDSGRFELVDLSPGRLTLHTWHPRFPPTTQQVDLVAGEALRLDLKIGVGRHKELLHDSR